VRLERQGATEDDWIVACRSPCDAQVSIEGTYRIAGEGVRTSAPFTLPSSDGRRLSIDVDTGSKAVLVLGIVLTSVSSAVALVGVVIHMLAKGADIDRSLAPTGIAVAAGGVAGVATGIVLIVMNARTTQTIEPARAARQPTWRAADWAPGISPQLMLPVLTF
jgi:hypothetical protein